MTESSLIKAYQIYFQEAQRDLLLDGFIPFFNEKATVCLESGVMAELVQQGRCSDCQWFGVFSHAVSQKLVDFDYPKLQKYCAENSDFELLAPHPEHYNLPYDIKGSHYILLQYPWLWPIMDTLLRKLGVRDTYRLMHTKSFGVYCNYFVARQDIYSDYVSSWLAPAIALFHNDTDLMEMGMVKEDYAGSLPPPAFSRDTGLDYYPRIPFVLERLINVYIVVNNIKVAWVL